MGLKFNINNKAEPIFAQPNCLMFVVDKEKCLCTR